MLLEEELPDDELGPALLDELASDELLEEGAPEELLDGRSPPLDEEGVHDELLNHPLEDTGPNFQVMRIERTNPRIREKL